MGHFFLSFLFYRKNSAKNLGSFSLNQDDLGGAMTVRPQGLVIGWLNDVNTGKKPP